MSNCDEAFYKYWINLGNDKITWEESSDCRNWTKFDIKKAWDAQEERLTKAKAALEFYASKWTGYKMQHLSKEARQAIKEIWGE